MGRRQAVKANRTQAYLKLLITGQSGGGKAQPLDAKILTPYGWTTMEEIQIGDEVINSQGLISRVTGVFPQGEKTIYKVTFNDGSSTECCDEHLWYTETVLDRAAKRKGSVKALSQIQGTLVYGCEDKKNHYIPMVKSVEFYSQEVPLDPYLLGSLIGDGCFQKEGVYFSNPSKEYVAALQTVLPKGLCFNQKQGSEIDWRITKGYYSNSSNAVLEALRNLGLNSKKSTEKFIPNSYKFNSSEVRIAVLQGLLDTDGYADGHNLEYSTSSEQLAKDFQFLVQSLGGKTRIVSKVPTYTHNSEKRIGAVSYRMNVSLPPAINPFRLQAKADRYSPRSKYPPYRSIASIEEVGVKQAQCIAVDAPDHLYVTDECIVTHNTTGSLLIANGLLSDIPVSNRKVYVFDTENGRSQLKADAPELPKGFEFDVDVFDPEVEGREVCGLDYVSAIDAAVEGGYHVIILDSISHEWDYIKAYVETLGGAASKHGNNWGKAKEKFHRPFKQRVRNSKIHVIATARAKTNRQQNSEGKTVKESGDVMTQPDAPFEYDFIFDIINREHFVEVDKTEGGLFNNIGYFKITEKTGQVIANWLKSADHNAIEQDSVRQELNGNHKERILDILKLTGQVKTLVPSVIQEVTGMKLKAEDLTNSQCNNVVRSLIAHLLRDADVSEDVLESNLSALDLVLGSDQELKTVRSIVNELRVEEVLNEELAGAIG